MCPTLDQFLVELHTDKKCSISNNFIANLNNVKVNIEILFDKIEK